MLLADIVLDPCAAHDTATRQADLFFYGLPLKLLI
jgi:hypothetical protein